MLMGVTLGGERPNLPTVVGAFVIVAGVVILLTDRRTLKE
jgi:drug/metabolite transporter (DMT)-like permease